MSTLEEILADASGALGGGPEAERHAGAVARCAAAVAELPEADRGRHVVAWFVPGRVELFGKHTDYAGGRSLLAATEQGFRILAIPRDDGQIRIRDAAEGGPPHVFPFSPGLQSEGGPWEHYPRTVARRLARNFADEVQGGLRGADVAFVSDLPRAAGLSSSSAFVVAVLAVLADVSRLERTRLYRAEIPDRTALATYAATVENGASFGFLAGDRGVGTFGGSEDHTEILCGKADHLSQFSFAPTRREAEVPWPEDRVLAIGASGVEAAKTGARMADYNRLSRQVRLMVEAFNEARGVACRTLRECVETLGTEGPSLEHFFAHLVSVRRDLGEWDLPGRAMQFREEDQVLTPQAADAVRAGDWTALGRLAERSHELAQECLRNQTPETGALQRLAREAGADAAAGFGAGFGGSVWACVEADRATDFLSVWRTGYAAHFPEPSKRARFFSTRPSAAAHRLVSID